MRTVEQRPSMLRSSYILSQGVGYATEKKLWAAGAKTWDDFAARSESLPVASRMRFEILETIDKATTALDRFDSSFFAQALSQSEHWRAISSFEKICFLDIETDGTTYGNCVTTIGISDGRDYKAYIQGKNLGDFEKDCASFDGFVTFFGGGFDIPVLKRRFPSLSSVFSHRLHVDLCPALRRLGYKGGLKSIEKQLGIARPDECEGLDGLDAVRFWAEYKRGGSRARKALDLLIAYNREDVMNMRNLLDFALPGLRALTGIDDA